MKKPSNISELYHNYLIAIQQVEALTSLYIIKLIAQTKRATAEKGIRCDVSDYPRFKEIINDGALGEKLKLLKIFLDSETDTLYKNLYLLKQKRNKELHQGALKLDLMLKHNASGKNNLDKQIHDAIDGIGDSYNLALTIIIELTENRIIKKL